MSKTIKLSIKPTFEFILIGIVCSEPIYKLSYLINEALSVGLKEHDLVKIYNKKRNVYQAFELFNYLDEESQVYYELIHNKGPQGALIEEQKHIDFFIKIENSMESAKSLVGLIKVIKNISLAFEIKPDSLKSKNNLIFSDEES